MPPRPSRILVAGNSRSGTTMLAKMLGRHTLVHTLQELHFVEELWSPDDGPLSTEQAVEVAERLLHNAQEWYHRRPEKGRFQHSARTLVAALPAPVLATDVLAAVLAHEAERAGKRVALEQTPRNVFFLAPLLDRLPGTRAVVVVRDPRDVLLSQKNWWRRRFRGTTGVPWRTTVRQWLDYHPVTTSLIWRSGVRAGLAEAGREEVLLVRFEDLAAAPEATMRDLLGRLGLSWEPAVLEAERISSSNGGDRDGVGVDPAVVGRFRTGLAPAELWWSQRLTGDTATPLGYQAVPQRFPVLGVVGQALLLPLKAAGALLLNLGRTRHVVSSVRRRLLG